MRNIIAYIFKYLAFALFIIVTLLYMEDYDLRQQAFVLLCGVVGIDVIFGIAGAIRKAVERQRKKKIDSLKRTVHEAMEAKKADAKNAKAEKTIEKLEAKLQKLEEKDRKAEQKHAPLLALPAPKDATGSKWESLKEKGAAFGSAIKDKLSGGDSGEGE